MIKPLIDSIQDGLLDFEARVIVAVAEAAPVYQVGTVQDNLEVIASAVPAVPAAALVVAYYHPALLPSAVPVAVPIDFA